MSKTDQAMSEYCSKHILKAFKSGTKPDEILFKNLLTSTASMIKNKERPGDNFDRLYRYLDAQFAYTNISEKSGFGAGAVFGSIKLLDEFNNLNKEVC